MTTLNRDHRTPEPGHLHGATTALSTNPGTASHDTPPAQDEVALYRRMGWPARWDNHQHATTVYLGNGLDALILPAALGHPVAQTLRAALMLGPVATDPTSSWWTFFTTTRPPDTHLPDEIRAARMHAVKPGWQALPPLAPRARWPQPPSPRRPVSLWFSVLATARKTLWTREHHDSASRGWVA